MRLLFVSNRLPIKANKDGDQWTFQPTVGGLATGLNAYLNSPKNDRFKKEDCIWIGWPGVNVEGEDQKVLEKQMLEEHNQYPVFLSESAMDHFYLGFCNKTIWPLFHYFPTYAEYEEKYWDEYVQVNEIFMNAVLDVMQEGDVLWIHDYHLLLLPAMIRKKFPKASIGFFLHIPFPAYEVYRLIPSQWRSEILQGMLGSDVVGFHTHEYAQYFERCCLRLLGYENSLDMITAGDREVLADAFPMNIDFESFYETAQLPESLEAGEELLNSMDNCHLILSIDRLDYSKGIINRLKAFEFFLENYPEWRNKVVLMLVVVPSRVQVESYQFMKKSIDELVGNINGNYGTMTWMPIVYQYKSLSFKPLTSLFKACKIALITPIRDGMNLIAKEFIASKTDQKGVLILSEMAGATYEMPEALIINPNNMREIADTLNEALLMPEEEQIKRNKALQARLRRYDVVKWADEFLNKLIMVNEHQDSLRTRLFADEQKENFKKAFFAADKRILFMDYDGTLVSFAKRPELAVPTPELLDIMKKLSKDDKTDVIIISGRDRFSLTSWFEGMEIDFAAEHGVWIREDNAEWQMLKNIDNSWKPSILSIFDKFTDKLPGTFAEEKEYAVVFHYRNADPELASQKVKDLVDELINHTSNSELQMLQGNKIIEVRHSAINKGNAGIHWLSKKDYDFIAAFGDDHTDEDLFKALPENAHSIKIGMAKTAANFNVADNGKILELLKEIADEL